MTNLFYVGNGDDGYLGAIVSPDGDGTGTRTTYDEHGNETSVEQLTDLPIPEAEPVEITLADVAAALRDPLANLTTASASTTVRTAILNQRAALDALVTGLPIPDLPADPDLTPPDPTRLRSPR